MTLTIHQQCHTHPKVKDGPKRRRETSSSLRARAASTSSNYATTTNASVESAQSLSDTSTVETPTNNVEAIKIEETKATPFSTPQMSQTPAPTPHLGAISTIPLVVDEQMIDHQQRHLEVHDNLHGVLPGLNIDANGIRTINPFDSFTTML